METDKLREVRKRQLAGWAACKQARMGTVEAGSDETLEEAASRLGSVYIGRPGVMRCQKKTASRPGSI